MCKGLAAGNQARISAMPHGEPCRCRARRSIEDVDPPARSRRASPDRSRPTQGPGRLRPGGRNNTSTVAKNPATGHARHGNERRSRPVPSPRNTGLLGRKIQADFGGLGGVDRHALDEAVVGLDPVRPDLDAVLADRDGVAGEALAVGTVATGFLVSVGVLDVRAGLQRLAVGRDLDPDRTAGDLQSFRRGLAGFHRHAVDELVRRTDAIGPDLDAVFADRDGVAGDALVIGAVARSEEHTSELQSLMRISYAV